MKINDRIIFNMRYIVFYRKKDLYWFCQEDEI